MTSSVGKPERQARPEEQARRGLPARELSGCVRHVRFTRAWARVIRQKNRAGAREFSFEKLPLGKPRGFPMSVRLKRFYFMDRWISNGKKHLISSV
ncbi:hypothetical protein ACFX1X_012645 [Malus domestica]